MSDRSGVGAPTHDGAEPESSGSDDDAGSRPATPRRRRAAELFGAALGGTPAAGAAPPGVPLTGPDDEDATSGAESTPDPADVPEKAPRARKAVARPTSAPAGASDPTVEDDRSPARTGAPAAEPTAARDAVPARVAVVDEDGRPPARRRGPLRARQVHRIIRRVDPWSVLKLSLVFYFCVWLMVVISGVLIWGVAVGSGTVESLEDFIARLLAFETFRFNADQIFRLFAMGGLIMVFLGTAVSAILAVLFNLISDLIGGIRITVIEEETTRRIVRKG